MSQQAKREYLIRILERYWNSSKRDKGLILNEFCGVCGLSRKHAIRKLKRAQNRKLYAIRPGPQPKYDQAVQMVLFQLWLAMRKCCSKKMVVAIPAWIEYAASWESLTSEVRAKLLQISPASIDRVLRSLKAQMQLRGFSTTKQGSFRKTKIPIRMHFWDIKDPGHMQADTVAHCGNSLEGAFGNSLTMTDIHTTWTENRAVWTKGSFRVFQQIRDIEENLPFPIKSYASDNGNEVLNQRIYNYFVENRPEGKKVDMTRAREYRKNDQAHVEQKNFSHVRQLFEYDRVGHPDVVDLMNEIYKHYWNPLQNFFIPSMKCIRKTRIGARIKKEYDAPKTPYQRLLDSADMSNEAKATLRARYQKLDPFKLSEGLDRKLREFFDQVKKMKLPMAA
jgi:hypothetical protein